MSKNKEGVITDEEADKKMRGGEKRGRIMNAGKGMSRSQLNPATYHSGVLDEQIFKLYFHQTIK